MRLPKSQEVLGKKFKVSIKLIDGAIGEFHPSRGITISPVIQDSDYDTLQTFFHECFHAVLYRSGISMQLSPELEESIVDVSATWLTDNLERLVRILEIE